MQDQEKFRNIKINMINILVKNQENNSNVKKEKLKKPKKLKN